MKSYSNVMSDIIFHFVDCSISLQWRHNERHHDGVLSHQPHDRWLNRSFGRRSMKTSKLRVTGLCVGNSPLTGEFPTQRASNAENVTIWWHHHVINFSWYTRTICCIRHTIILQNQGSNERLCLRFVLNILTPLNTLSVKKCLIVLSLFRCCSNVLKCKQIRSCVCRVQICKTHWGRVTHICVSRLTGTGSGNGLSPGSGIPPPGYSNRRIGAKPLSKPALGYC